MSESDKPSSLSLGKKITFAFIVVIGLLAIGEVAARFLVKLPEAPDGSQSHREHEQLIQVMGLPGLNATMEFDPDRFWRLRQELRDLRIAGTIRDQKIEFTVNTYGGLRNASIDPVKSKPRILAIGDSCTFGLGVNDDKTWPVQLQSLLDAKGLDAEVINAGVPGYTSYQGLRFLETQGLKMKPDIVVVCFGFNDSDTWASTSDLQMAENQSLRSMDRTLANSRLYYAFQKLLRGGGTKPNQQKEKRPRLTPEEYVGMLGGIHQRCIDAGATMVLVTWPYRKQIQEKSDEPWGYQGPTLWFSQQYKVPCARLVKPFGESKEKVFVDHVHASDEGCRVAAETISTHVIPLLNKTDEK